MGLYMSPEDAAARLGIKQVHLDAFVAMVDLMRVQDAADEELLAKRAELARVDDELRKAGIEYPLGARGVHDLRVLSEPDEDATPQTTES